MPLSSSTVVHNLEVLSACKNPQDLNLSVPDFRGHTVFSPSSRLGHIWKVLHTLIGLFYFGSSARSREIILRTQTIALEKFQRFLSSPQKTIPNDIKPLFALSFFPKEIDRLHRVAQILGVSNNFPLLAKAQREVAPQILQEISASFIPWHLLRALMQKEKLSTFDTERLHTWIHDINMLGALISPTLLLSVFELVAQQLFPNQTPDQQASHAFFLSWQLFKEGLKQVSSAEVGPVAYEVASPQHRLGEELDWSFPFDFQVTAHEVENAPHLMGLRSPAPLLLGTWYYNLQEVPSLIPYIACHSFDLRGRHMITERIDTTLEEYCWDEKLEERNRTLLHNFSDLISKLLSVKNTPFLDPDSFLVTSSQELRLMAPLRKRSFFSLHILEKFIRDVCKRNQPRIRLVFDKANVFDHPEAQFYINLLETYKLDLTDEILQDELAKAHLPDAVFPHVQKWRLTLRKKANQIYKTIRRQNPEWKTKHINYVKSAITQATLTLQKRGGFITVFPESFVADAVELMQQQETSQKTLRFSFLKKIFSSPFLMEGPRAPK